MAEYKIIITGPMGAGKTTAIEAVSEVPVVSTDVANTAKKDHAKATTTVAMDYGELTLGGGDHLRLYGTPGQQRFEFMWKILAKGALGLIVLMDNARPNAVRDLDIYLDNFAELIADTGVVIGITRMDVSSQPSLEDYHRSLRRRGVVYPIMALDVRKKQEVVILLDTLFSILEAAEA